MALIVTVTTTLGALPVSTAQATTKNNPIINPPMIMNMGKGMLK